MAGRESRDRSESTELGTAEEARAQALEVIGYEALSQLFSFFISFACFPWFSFLLPLFLAAGQDRGKRRGDRSSGD